MLVLFFVKIFKNLLIFTRRKDSSRVWVNGFGKSTAQKAVWANKKYVANSKNSGIIKENAKKPITAITDKAIDKVPKLKIQGYTDEQCNIIQKQHQELLRYSRNKNSNKEVAFVFDNTLNNCKKFIGEDDRLEFGNILYGKNLFVMHNHPRNSSFSLNDLYFFINNSAVKTLTIVKNNGDVEIIIKSNVFSIDIAQKEIRRLIKSTVKMGSDSEYDKVIMKFLHSERSGVIYARN